MRHQLAERSNQPPHTCLLILLPSLSTPPIIAKATPPTIAKATPPTIAKATPPTIAKEQCNNHESLFRVPEFLKTSLQTQNRTLCPRACVYLDSPIATDPSSVQACHAIACPPSASPGQQQHPLQLQREQHLLQLQREQHLLQLQREQCKSHESLFQDPNF